MLRSLGHKQALGAKAAVAVVLGRRLTKSKSVTTSNWGAARALHAMGYAVAESLALFSLAGAETDDCVELNLAEAWEAAATAARAGARAARRSQARGRKQPR